MTLKNFDTAGLLLNDDADYEPVCHVLGCSERELGRARALTNQTSTNRCSTLGR
jgi:hypothetical protein